MTCQFKVLPTRHGDLCHGLRLISLSLFPWIWMPLLPWRHLCCMRRKEKRCVMVECGEVAEFYRFARFFARMCCRPFERLISWQQILKATFDALKSTYRQFDGGEKNIWKHEQMAFIPRRILSFHFSAWPGCVFSFLKNKHYIRFPTAAISMFFKTKVSFSYHVPSSVFFDYETIGKT